MLFALLFRKKYDTLDDKILVDLVRSGDQGALGELFTRYAHLMRGLILNYINNADQAEDILMDLIEHLPVKIQKSEITYFKSWLYTVCKNECLMYLRKKALPTAEVEKSFGLYDESDFHFQLSVLNEQKLSLLESKLNDLKEEQRTCIELFYLKNHSYEEICSVTGYSLNHVKSHLQNGKRNLKLLLENHAPFKNG